MGNKQQRSAMTPGHIELDRSEAIYSPNEIVSGSVLHLKHRKAFVLLTGIIYFEKHKKKGVENCEIIFFSTKFDLIPSLTTKQNFQLHLNEHLPPSFNNLNISPNISYSINLVYRSSKDRIHFSIPIRICPIIQIDHSSLLTPYFFGPIENPNYGTKLDVKINRSIFKFDDIIEIYYQLQNRNNECIHKLIVSLGVYYLVESNIWQEDISNSIIDINNILSKNKLIQNKILLNIPNKIYLPPTFKYKYDQGDHQSMFNLNIDYKIQFKIYLGNSENLWQVDVPIVICNQLLEQTEIETQNSEGLQNSSQQDSEFYTKQQNLNNSHGQLLA
jgi:hypothetical protein